MENNKVTQNLWKIGESGLEAGRNKNNSGYLRKEKTQDLITKVVSSLCLGWDKLKLQSLSICLPFHYNRVRLLVIAPLDSSQEKIRVLGEWGNGCPISNIQQLPAMYVNYQSHIRCSVNGYFNRIMSGKLNQAFMAV